MQKRSLALALSAALVSTGLLSACATVADNDMAEASSSDGMTVVTGKMGYRERIALLPGAELSVVLLDSSLDDPLSNLFAATTVPLDGQQVPIAFSLPIEHKRLNMADSYEIRGIIRAPDGRMLWRTDGGIPVDLNQKEQDVGTVTMVRAQP